jgi:L-rhamnonate dehydratase
MKITEIRTRVVRWRGKTVALPPHFCPKPQCEPSHFMDG